MNETTNSTASGLTVKNVLRGLSALCILFVFCPTFMVSCSGQKESISVITAVRGISSDGTVYVEPHPVMLIALALPVLILVMLMIKKYPDVITSSVIAAASAADIIVWFLFRSAAAKTASEYLCTLETTFWFYLNLLALILMTLLAGLTAAGILSLNGTVSEIGSRVASEETLNQVNDTLNQMSEKVKDLAENISSGVSVPSISKKEIIGYCCNCGSPIPYGNRFCTRCGNPVSEDLLAKAEAARRESAESATGSETDCSTMNADEMNTTAAADEADPAENSSQE